MRNHDRAPHAVPPHTVIGTPGAALVAELAVEPDDPIIDKRRYNCFLGTELGLLLLTWLVSETRATHVGERTYLHRCERLFKRRRNTVVWPVGA